MYCYSENVPSTGSDVFDGVPITDLTLYVPANLIELYSVTEPWNGFNTLDVLWFELNGIYYNVLDEASIEVTSPREGAYEVIDFWLTNSDAMVEYFGKTYHVIGIGNRAFFGATNLKYANLMANCLQYIGTEAFCGCRNLDDVVFSLETRTIGDFAFAKCTSLRELHIQACVESIGTAAFAGCSSLSKIKVNSYNPKYDSREDCNAIISTNTNTILAGCKNTKIPYSVIGIDTHAFFECTDLKEIIIPEGVTTLGWRAFYGCLQLESVTIPKSVKKIYSSCFENCKNLSSITCFNTIPPTGTDAFYNASTAVCNLRVPASAVYIYKSTSPWDEFANIEALPLVDGEEFENNIEQEVGTLTYTRTLPNMLWNPLYVPFKIPYEDLEENYEVAYINAMHSYDNDDNGEIDDMVMEIVKVKAGTLKPNHPYLIKAKNEEAKEMSIVQENATLYPAEITTLDCSSVYTKFEITGTYQEMTSGDLNGSLVISTDGAWKLLSSTSILRPFRFYLTISSREGSPVEIAEEAMSRVRIRVMGEDDNATGIDEVKTANEEQKSEIYDLLGRRVSAPAKGGVYIIKGKKVIY